ncbi:Sorting nexin, cytoplasm-to-vacuole targeting pathway/endosomal sorting [Mucor velutinosus]|uniref:MMS19 nucleotide excision repair protein n=1 Tax=Mucor velutinosus TaxID=708070 RepID=A0AAN7DJ74_9FUNG|nr:Sorting nexin, cytoplasm-to-vacuole targeting pathway/endosomal sorting [Mucor velutinosus]
MSNSMEKHVTEFMITENNGSFSSGAAKRIVEIVNEEDAKSNLLSLIQSLGEYLTHEDDSLRAKATSLLSYTLEHVEQEKLNEAAVSVLVNFYCSRLSDLASVPNLMSGLVALTSKFDGFNAACTNTIVSSLGNDIQVQSFAHVTRNAAFKVFENLLEKHSQHVKSITNEFITVFIQSITNEKDPRNLMSVYTVIQKIVKLLDISQHVEELFAATFCYFPITFRPPPDNPYGITAKDLKLNLRKCMASTPLFSEFALPLLLQKMSTTSGSAKKDSLETITACASVYPPKDILAVGSKLLDAIKIEIINGSPDPGLRDPSLNAIHAITKAITSDSTSKEDDVTKVLKPLVDDCVHLLGELEEDTVKPASLILRSIASASAFAYTLIESTVLPLLLRQYRTHDAIPDRYLILCTMVAIIQARKIVYGAATGSDDGIEVGHDSILVSYKSKFVEIFSHAINTSKEHPEIRLMGTLGLGLLCVLKNFLTRSERAVSVQALSLFLETEEEDRLRMSVEMSLMEISSFDASLVRDITVPVLINLLPDFSSMDGNTNIDIVPYKLTLATINKLCIPPTIYEATEQELLTKFLYICSHNQDKRYAREIISTLLTLVRTKDSDKQPDIKACSETLLPKLFASVVSAVTDETADPNQVIILSDEILETVNLILLTVLKNLGTSEQEKYAVQAFSYFKDLDLNPLGLKAAPTFCPLSAQASKPQAACTQLFATVIASFRKNVTLPIQSNESFLDEIVGEALKSTHEKQILAFSRIIASVINKWKDDVSFQAYLDTLKLRLEQLVEAKSQPALSIYIWVTKALVTRAHKKNADMIDYLINVIPDPVVGKHASSGFDILIGDDALCLNKQCYANISFLYKQKFMTFALPKLLKNFNASTEDEKLNFLIAIAYLLKNVPRSILIDELPPLVPLLIESMSFPDTVLKLSTLDLFQFSLQEATDIMAKHILTLLPAFTSLIGPAEKSMKVRISALKCIGLISTNISRDVVLPYVKDTLKAIAVPLDDKKRLVRRQAVECRESWYLIGSK